MPTAEWVCLALQSHATHFAQSASAADFAKAVRSLYEAERIAPTGMRPVSGCSNKTQEMACKTLERLLPRLMLSRHLAAPAAVLVAHDNRPSAETLLEAATAGCNAGSAATDVAVSFGEQTTPCLHWMVMMHPQRQQLLPLPQAYIAALAQGFVELLGSTVQAEAEVRPRMCKT